MSDNPQDKKDTVPDVPSTKSYSTDGATVEFDPGALQMHAVAPELRQQISEAKLPRLDPKYLVDTAPPNQDGSPAAAANTAATTQPSLRRVAKAREQPNWRERGWLGLVVLLGLVVFWQVTVLVRTQRSAHPGNSDARKPAEARAVVQSSQGARPRLDATLEPAAASKPVEVAKAASAQSASAPEALSAAPARVPPAPDAASEPAPAGRNLGLAASAPRVATSADLSPLPPKETSELPRSEGSPTPQLATSSKPPSKVLFPPQ